MRLLLYEHLSALGGTDLSGGASAALALEGLAMLEGIVEDFSQLPDVQVVVPPAAWCDWNPPACVQVLRGDPERSVIESLSDWLSEIDAVLVVAPESEGILEALTRQVETAGVRNLGSSSLAVRLAADKLLTARRLEERSVPTIETWGLAERGVVKIERYSEWVTGIGNRPVMIKPRYGAGSQLMTVHRELPTLPEMNRFISEGEMDRDSILQPYIDAIPLSVAVWCEGNDRDYAAMAIGDQLFGDEMKFEYRGGVVPSQRLAWSPQRIVEIRDLAVEACRCVPGLRGYVGVDLILPKGEQGQALVCEINPRLTTSYLGYRVLSLSNPAAQWLQFTPETLDLRGLPIRFHCDGTIEPYESAEEGLS